MKLSNLLGTDLKERLKKIVFRYKNRNFKPYVVDRTLCNTPFKFYVADKDGEAWYVDSSPERDAGKKWQWPEMEFVYEKICAPGDVILECGGHQGLTAVVLSKWVGDAGHVFCFEPNPDNVVVINQNLQINQTSNVTVVPYAVGAAHGSIKVTHSSSNSYILKDSEKNGIDVPVVKADDYLQHKPNVLKVDVEGFEVEILKGATELLKTRPKLIIEIHPDMMQRYGSSVDELFSFIPDGYDLWIQWDKWNLTDAPLPYDRKASITHWVHLFGLPR